MSDSKINSKLSVKKQKLIDLINNDIKTLKQINTIIEDVQKSINDTDKICPSCKQTKKGHEFDSRHNACKECRKLKNKEYYKANKVKWVLKKSEILPQGDDEKKL